MTTDKHDHAARMVAVKGHFGELQLTKVSFAKRWVDHACEMRRLSSTTDWQKFVDRLANKTRVYANIEFERMYEDQNK